MSNIIKDEIDFKTVGDLVKIENTLIEELTHEDIVRFYETRMQEMQALITELSKLGMQANNLDGRRKQLDKLMDDWKPQYKISKEILENKEKEGDEE